MAYYMGDYYRGDYYRGDPFLGGIVKGIAKVAGAVLPGPAGMIARGISGVLHRSPLAPASAGGGASIATLAAGQLRAATGRRRRTKRKLKFGSAAWRAKYGRKKRRRR